MSELCMSAEEATNISTEKYAELRQRTFMALRRTFNQQIQAAAANYGHMFFKCKLEDLQLPVCEATEKELFDFIIHLRKLGFEAETFMNRNARYSGYICAWGPEAKDIIRGEP